MCVARSRSPSQNQVGQPYRPIIASVLAVSSRMPQPVTGLAMPASV
jgi:hypothetical protein